MTDGDRYPIDQVGEVSAARIAEAWRRECPGVPVDSITVVTPLWRLAKLLADDRRQVLAHADIEPATLDLVSTLRRSGPPYELSTKELSARCLVTAGAISQRVARAEADGLVTRAGAPGGGRTVIVSLTDKGHALTEDVVHRILRRENDLISGLDARQRDTLAELLDVLLTQVRERVD